MCTYARVGPKLQQCGFPLVVLYFIFRSCTRQPIFCPMNACTNNYYFVTREKRPESVDLMDEKYFRS